MHAFHQLNKAFDHRIRLAIMSLLMVHDQLDFNSLKNELQVTDGNLASHILALEKNAYLSVTKQFVGKKPQTSYAATIEGKHAFEQHLTALANLIKQTQ
ncbi:MAG: transcriptional regulator [Sediminibacterium sp.]|jgi:predicted ArsR family transcriptional regulator|nr:transcriptional regulator [Hydrotalea sp.]MCU0338160.1 transcriptional regulator [Sediminibacterium sp.]